MIIIRTARIPIIKLETTTRVTADISLGDGSGPKAARYVAQQVRGCVFMLVFCGFVFLSWTRQRAKGGVIRGTVGVREGVV
jgi:hypothetical protein